MASPFLARIRYRTHHSGDTACDIAAVTFKDVCDGKKPKKCMKKVLTLPSFGLVRMMMKRSDGKELHLHFRRYFLHINFPWSSLPEW